VGLTPPLVPQAGAVRTAVQQHRLEQGPQPVREGGPVLPSPARAGTFQPNWLDARLHTDQVTTFVWLLPVVAYLGAVNCLQAEPVPPAPASTGASTLMAVWNMQLRTKTSMSAVCWLPLGSLELSAACNASREDFELAVPACAGTPQRQ
jgi:hypothetical protein